MQQPKFKIFDKVTIPCKFRSEENQHMTIERDVVGFVNGIKYFGEIEKGIPDYRYFIKIDDFSFENVHEDTINGVV